MLCIIHMILDDQVQLQLQYTMLVLVVSLMAIAGVAHGVVVPSNTPNGDEICFKNHRKGLAWPIPQTDDIGGIMGHGIHCLETVINFTRNHPRQKVDRMHMMHCARITGKIYQYVKHNAESNYLNVSRLLCEDFFEGFTIGMAEKAEYFHLYLEKYLSPKELSASPQKVYDAIEKISYDKKDPVGGDPQEQLYVYLKAINYGTLLMLEFDGKPMNPVERAYLDKWVSPRLIRIGAMALSCTLNLQGRQLAMYLRNVLTRRRTQG